MLSQHARLTVWELLVRELWHWERLYFSSQVGCGSAPVMNGAHLAPSIEVYDEGEELEHWLKVSTTETESVSLAFCTTAFSFEVASVNCLLFREHY